AFDPSVATLMDFRTDQSKGTTFFYVLPFSTTEALVEYTLFSEKVLSDEAYEEALKKYIEDQLKIQIYEVKEKEFGVIPMTNYLFPQRQNNIINIGTAGGQTKGSSGYTFRFIQKHSRDIVQSLVQAGHPFLVPKTARRFQFYDSVLLHILQHRQLPGAAIFTDLFKKNAPQEVLQFLDNETSLAEELRIISTLPTLPFAKAAFQHIKGGR
ncbi:MAG: lycopene cyclase, partial [Flavisolibacter sp.]|nr:lycopene cyclase [Flavisolibacter sp.]